MEKKKTKYCGEVIGEWVQLVQGEKKQNTGDVDKADDRARETKESMAKLKTKQKPKTW